MVIYKTKPVLYEDFHLFLNYFLLEPKYKKWTGVGYYSGIPLDIRDISLTTREYLLTIVKSGTEGTNPLLAVRRYVYEGNRLIYASPLKEIMSNVFFGYKYQIGTRGSVDIINISKYTHDLFSFYLLERGWGTGGETDRYSLYRNGSLSLITQYSSGGGFPPP